MLNVGYEFDLGSFAILLLCIWWYFFSAVNSCGFEHVFVGESRDHQVSGFHNWVQFYLQEKRGHIDYRGYFRRGTVSLCLW